MDESKYFLSDLNREDQDDSWSDFNVCKVEITPALLETLDKAVEVLSSASKLFKGPISLRIHYPVVEILETTDAFCETELMDHIVNSYKIVGGDEKELQLLDDADDDVLSTHITVYFTEVGSVEFGCVNLGHVRYRSTNILVSELKKAVGQ